jgi:outer membrane protein assembly factor BamB
VSRLALLSIVALGACGGKAVFRLSSDDNNAYVLRETLTKRQLPVQPTPVNSARQPRLFAATAKSIIAYDLADAKPLWTASAEVSSRIAVAGDFIVEAEGKQLVARDQKTGAVRWKASIPGTFVGVAADRERAYLVYHEGERYYLAGYDGSGSQRWKADADGTLGAPAAHGGVVYAPFLHQWLSIIDGKTGAMMTRIRGIDEQILMLRVTSQVAYYGSKKGVFRLDERSASGRRDDAIYTQLKVPAQLDRASYGRDVYDDVQSGYSAADRARVLYAAEPTSEGPTKLVGDGYAIHYFRYMFGFASTGEPRWVYAHPRVELVASDHTGLAIVALGADGEIVALDPQTGAVRAREKLAPQQPILGATFDADGWLPSGNEPVEMTATLVAIARDHDARFDRVKELAVQLLAKQNGEGVTKELLGVLADDRAPQRLKDTVAELLVARKDPQSVPALRAQLAAHTDFIAKTEPEALGPVAKAIGGLGGTIDPKERDAALAALQYHLEAPTTAIPDLVAVIDAMAAIGGGAERSALASHLLLYHDDDELAGSPAWSRAIVLALDKAGPAERELLRFVATDPRTKPTLMSSIRDTLHD